MTLPAGRSEEETLGNARPAAPAPATPAREHGRGARAGEALSTRATSSSLSPPGNDPALQLTAPNATYRHHCCGQNPPLWEGDGCEGEVTGPHIVTTSH